LNTLKAILLKLKTSAIEIIKDSWSYEAVFRYLKAGLINMDKRDIDLIENYVLSNGIRGSRWTNDERWNYRINFSFENQEMSEYEKNLIDRVNEIRQRIVPPLTDLGGSIKRKKSVREVCAALYKFLCQIEVPSAIENYIEQFKSEGEMDLAKEYSQIWNMIMEILDQMVEVMGEENLSLEQFSKVLSIGLGQFIGAQGNIHPLYLAKEFFYYLVLLGSEACKLVYPNLSIIKEL